METGAFRLRVFIKLKCRWGRKKTRLSNRYPSEVGYVLQRHPRVGTALVEAQEARARRLEIQADLVASKYLQLILRAREAKDFETALKALNQLCDKLKVFERHQALPVLEAMEQAPNDWDGMLKRLSGLWPLRVNTMSCSRPWSSKLNLKKLAMQKECMSRPC